MQPPHPTLSPNDFTITAGFCPIVCEVIGEREQNKCVVRHTQGQPLLYSTYHEKSNPFRFCVVRDDGGQVFGR